MEKRLNEKGIHTMDELLSLDSKRANEVWGSVLGEEVRQNWQSPLNAALF